MFSFIITLCHHSYEQPSPHIPASRSHSYIKVSVIVCVIQSSFGRVLLNLSLLRLCNIFGRMTETAEELSHRIGELVLRYQAIREEQTTSSRIASQLVPLNKVEPIRIVKTASMTYSEYLNKVLKQVSAIKSIGLGGRYSYRLVEDLQIILALSNQPNITGKFFEELSKSGKINRSADSIRARYNDVLCHISESDMKKITDYLEQQGIEGYLVLVDGEIRIQESDPREGTTAKRTRPESLDKEEKKTEKRARRQVPPHLSQLNEVLSIYSKTVNTSIVQLLQYLQRASGDLVALDRYIETRDERLLWTEQEDGILKAGGFELQVLKRYRSEKEVQARKNYLNI